MESIWTQNCTIEKHQPLLENEEVEIAVIGAGMAGILIAYHLKEAGKQVIVLEANHIGSGQTQHTTAKITSQHHLLYHHLLVNKGEEKARQYAMANQKAIKEYERIIKKESIDCHFEYQPSFVFSDDFITLEQEQKAAIRLGLPASIVEQVSLPVPVKYAIKFEQQAQFHPLRFLKALAKNLTIYENTFVQTVNDHMIVTTRGTITAQKIVFACHYPFLNFPGMYFTKMHQERSYVLALKNTTPLFGMYIGEWEEQIYSFRSYQDLLLFGGGGHRTGENSLGGKYEALRTKAKQLFPASYEVAHWSAQDCMPTDKVPFIGVYSNTKPHWYVATGFQKWGMTSSMVSALLIRDAILGKENPYAEVFSPQRFSTETMSGILCEGSQAVKGLSKRFFQIPEAKNLPIHHGGIITVNHEKVGVYKDENEKLFCVVPKCPHLGCQLEWNPDELSWDCPCHGSRFDYEGNRLNGPAQKGVSHESYE